MYSILLFVVSLIAGGVASIAGFGIGSLLTPLFALKTGTALAIGAISIVHFLGTLLRFLIRRKYINKRILLTFGITSAIGGLIGALFHNILYSPILTFIFACLLIFAGITGLSGISEKWHLHGKSVWIAGAISGLFGGLVGNQGGIRSAAMFGLDLKEKEFVATATGIALAVDLVRMPVYFTFQWKEILSVWPLVVISAIGVLIGTEIGVWTLHKIPETLFKRIVSGIILLIGLAILVHK